MLILNNIFERYLAQCLAFKSSSNVSYDGDDDDDDNNTGESVMVVVWKVV